MADVNTQVVSMVPAVPPTTVIDPAAPMTDAQKNELAAQIADTGAFKIKTQYIVIGDEMGTAKGVVNLKAMLKKDDYEALFNYLTYMPRSMLWNFFMLKIWPGIPDTPTAPMSAFSGMGAAPYLRQQVNRGPLFPKKRTSSGMGAGAILWQPATIKSIYGDSHKQKPYEKMVWAAFVDLFNEANLKYVNDNQMEPWDWEEQKTNAYYISTSKDAIDQLGNEIDEFRNVALALDPVAKDIMEQYLTLTKLGDPGLEVNRQNAIKELLKKREYGSAQAIIDAFKYVEKTRLGTTLTKPIPFNIVTSDGKTIAKAT